MFAQTVGPMINWQLVQEVTLPPVCKSAVIGSCHHMTLRVGGKQKKTTQHDFIVMEVLLSRLPRLCFNILSRLRSRGGAFGLDQGKPHIVALPGSTEHENSDWST